MKKQLVLFLLFAGIYTQVHAQTFSYDVDFITYFDNREYQSALQPSQTIFGTRLSPEIGVIFNDSLGGTHKMMAGVSYIQPFGAQWQAAKLIPTVYYQYKQSGFTVSLGAIPYTHLQHALPDYLMSDSMSFAYPNIQGALFQYQSKWGFAEFLCDWRGLPSSTTREAFRLIMNGQFHYDWFLAGGYGQLNHLANKSSDQPNLGVCDDSYVNPFIGVDFSNKTPFDSLSLKLGYLVGMQRDRKQNRTYTPQGATIDLFARWKFLGIQNRLYVGDNLMPLYGTYGTLLNQGNAFYQSPIYNRTDLMIYIIQRPFVNCYFAWNLHYTKGEKLGHQQQLVVHFNLDAIKHNSGRLQNLFDK